MIFFRYLNRILLFAFLLNFCLPFDVVAKGSGGKSKDAYSYKEYKGKKKKKDDKYCDCGRGSKHYKKYCKCKYKGHKYCDDGGRYKKKCKYCNKDAKYHKKYCKHKHKCNKYCDCNDDPQQPCELYPIAIPSESLNGLQEGDSITLLSGSDPEQFGWLSWDGYKSDEKELAESLEQPGDSYTYCNPDDYKDSVVSVGDWVFSAYKIKKDKYLSKPLDRLIEKPIVLPVWDKTRGYKSKLAYRVSGFATFSITDYDFSKDYKGKSKYSKSSKKSKSKSKYSKGSKYQQFLTLTFLSYTQCDGSGGGGQAPVADDQTVILDEDTLLELTLTGSDPDSDPITYSLISTPENGNLTGTAPNLTYSPNLNYNGSDSFTFSVSDGTLESEVATVSLQITPVNDAPVAIADTATTDEDSAIVIDVLANDTDVDVGDPLSVASVSDFLNGTAIIDPVENTIIFTPDADFNGTASFNYIAQDNNSLSSVSSEVTITVNPINDSPLITSTAPTTATEGILYTYQLQIDDPDNLNNGTDLSFSLSNEPTSMTVSPTGLIEWTPAEGQTEATNITVTVADGGEDGAVPASEVFSLTITPIDNEPIASPQSVSTDEDTDLVVQLTGTDPEDQPLTFVVESLPENGTLEVSGTPITAIDLPFTLPADSLNYQPATDYVGSDSFDFYTDDGALDSQPASVSITIGQINDAPVALGATLNTGEETPVSIVLQANDAEDDALTFAVMTLPSGGTLADANGDPVLSGQMLPDASLTYTPNPGFFFTDGLTFMANDGVENSTEAPVIITVAPDPRSKTWTTTTDFREGSLASLLAEDPADQLRLGFDTSGASFLWIPVSTKGTIARIDIESARVLGEYRSAPSASESLAREFPSRVTFDYEGNAWIANRSGLVLKMVPPNGSWRDKNGDGQLTTSTGLNEQLLWTIPQDSDPLTAVERADYAEDELINLAIRTGISNVNFIGIDPEGHLWVGSTSGRNWRQFDGNTGEFLREEVAPVSGLGGYGGFIDPQGVLYSTGRVPLKWDTKESMSDYDVSWAETHRSDAWDIIQDYNGQFWESKDWNNDFYRYDADGDLIEIHTHNLRWAQGLSVDFDNHLWAAHSHCSKWVSRWLPNGTYIGKVQVANHGPTDVTVDRRGYVWATGTPGVVQRINPLAGPIGLDGETPVGEVDIQTPNLGGNIWAFGEFAGISSRVDANSGEWTAVFDGEIPGAVWGPVIWNADLCNDSLNVVEVSFSANGSTGWSEWEPILSVGDTPVGVGRFIRVRSSLSAADSGESPILKDLTVGTLGYSVPAATTDWYVDAGARIDGHWPDPIQMKGALCYTQTYEQNLLPSYEWSVVSADGAVVFEDVTALRPNVTFGGPGDYLLKLTATTDTEVREDTILVHLVPYNKAPYVNAGDNAAVFRENENFVLEGIVRDDGLPEPPNLNVTWEKKFGPGDVFFSDVSDPEATASFAAPGIYLLQLSADDGE